MDCVCFHIFGHFSLFKDEVRGKEKKILYRLIKGQVVHLSTLLSSLFPQENMNGRLRFLTQLVLLGSFHSGELLRFSQAAPRSGAFKGF